jgi:CubicO group peptidase (beta-lactamase class C family)
MRYLIDRVAVLAILVLLPLSLWADTYTELGNYFEELYPSDQPGAVIIITQDGKPVYKQAFGMADMSLDVPNRTEMVFQLGSITKQFTAVAIMMLEQEGKLKLTDDVTRYLPEYQTPTSTITIENLLTHTSGIPNYTSIEGWFENRIQLKLTDDEMMDGWENLPLEFEPGSKFAYSNSGYYMLGAIIEAASGIPYDEFVETRIFKKLGMNHSYYDHSERIVPNHASGYSATPDGGFENASYLDMGQPGAAGALASTVDDMAIWDASLYTDILLPASARERMWTAYTLSDGSKSDYAYGWSVGDRNGNHIIHHGGGIPGFQTSGFRLTDQKVYIAVLSNGSATRPGVAAEAAVKAVLGEPFRWSTIEMSEAELQPYTGNFKTPDAEERAFEVEDGVLKLVFSPEFKLPLSALKGGTFGSPMGELRFGGTDNSIEYVEVQPLVGDATRWLKQQAPE